MTCVQGRTRRDHLYQSVSVIALAMCAAAGASSPGFAAGPATQSPGPTVLADVGGIPTILVSAPALREAVSSAPSSVSAMSGQDLQSRGVSNITNVMSSSSNVSLKNEGDPGQTEVEMRGMTANGGNMPTSGFYLDGIPLTPPANAQNGKVIFTPTLYDLDGVDVQRGPQGTSYGAGSMGGAVLLNTNPPDLTGYHVSLQSTLSGTQGGGFNHANNIMANVPLVEDKLAIRIVGSEDFTSGWINRIVANPFPEAVQGGAVRGDVQNAPIQSQHPGSNWNQIYGTRVTVTLKPNDRLTITPSFYYQSAKAGGISAYDQFPGTETRYQPFNIPEPGNDKIAIYRLEAKYLFDTFQLTSTSAYWTRRSSQTEDGSEDFNNPLTGATLAANGLASQPGFYGPNGSGQVFGVENDTTSQVSQELRFSSLPDPSRRFSWVAGGYFSDYWSRWTFQGLTANPAQYMDIGTFAPATTNQWFIANSPTEMREYALYSEGTYNLTNKLKATFGLRLYDYDSSFASTISGWGSAYGAAAPAYSGVIKLNSWGINPKINLTYEFDPNLLVYTNIARGARPGGGNNFYPSTGPYWSGVFAPYHFSGTWPATYKPDSVWSYEVGEKATFFDGRLGLDSAAFVEDWENMALQAMPGDWPLDINAKRALIYGLEVDARADLGGGFKLKGSGGYTRGFVNAGPHWVIPSVLTDVAPLTGDVQLSYEYKINDKLTFTVLIDNSYVAERYSLSFNYGYSANGTYIKMPPYDITNLRASIESTDGWGLAMFVNNATDTHARLDNLIQETLPSAAYNRIITNQPLTAGIELSSKF